jgi:hypothetical protein
MTDGETSSSSIPPEYGAECDWAATFLVAGMPDEGACELRIAKISLLVPTID